MSVTTALSVIAAGPVINTSEMETQPAESVMITWIGPSQRPVAVGWPCTAGGGDQMKVYGATPPVGPTVAVPSHAPGQVTGVLLLLGTIVELGSMVKAIVVSQPDSSVRVTV
jgi:hypothetical protein